MYLLFDECCAKPLVTIAERQGYTAQRSIEVGALGPGASDATIFEFASRVGAVVVTVNRADFVDLACRAGCHPGVIVIPSLGRERLRPLFEAVLAAAELHFARHPGVVLEVDARGRITSFRTD